MLPVIAPYAAELKGEGVTTLVSLAGSAVADAVAAYHDTSGEIILAAARIAHIAPNQAERMVKVIPSEKMFDSKEGEKLLPAIAAAGMKHGAGAIGLSLSVAEQSFSSAVHVARRISALPSVPDGYLGAFDGIVQQVGAGMVGYGLKQLLDSFNHDEAKTSRFVDQGLATAKRYGRNAAQEFFERKTAASRRA
jgi:hypothetical protein